MQTLLQALVQFPQDIPDVIRSVTEALKVWIAIAGIGLVLAWNALRPTRRRWVLIVLVVIAGANYLRWGPRLLFQNTDNYDLFHYYLNAKYFDELGYFDLYPAGILVDHENKGPFLPEGEKYLAQDSSGHQWRPIAHALERGREVKQKFTTERWEQFTHDALVLQREKGQFDGGLWKQMIQDHGFNGTPAWVAEAKPLASLVPIEYKKLLCFLDVGLLAVGVLAIGWAYGVDAALWTFFFLCVTYSTRWPTISWAYLRYDYVASLLVALALIKKGRHFLAGLLAGHAAALRFFPAMYMFGPAAKGLFELLGGRIDRKLLALGLSFLLGTGAFVALGAWAVGPANVQEHFENMMDHNSAEQLSSRRIGFAMALPFRPFRDDPHPKNITKEIKAQVDEQKPLRFGISMLALAGFAWGLRNKRDDETFAYGWIPFFLLTTASYYYYVVRVVLIAHHAGEIDKLRNRVGLVLLLGLEAMTNFIEVRFGGEQRVLLVGCLAWGCSFYAIAMLVLLALDRGEPKKAPA
jgi:hypothetical protein